MAFENITLEKGMYHVPGKSFTEVLESLDNSREYANTPLAGLDAYQRQLKRFGIRVSGPSSDAVEKFFSSTQSAALFPEYVSRAVRQGMEGKNRLPDMVATVTKIDGLDYRTISAEDAKEDRTLRPVLEGTKLPETKIRTNDSLVRLMKRGRMIVSSYEALRFQKLDLLTVTLRQIGAYIAEAQMKDAVDALMNGDGSHGGIAVKQLSAAPTYNDLVELYISLSPYTVNTILAGTDAMQTLLKLDTFRDGESGLDFHGTGRLITPLGATLVHVPGMDPKTVIGLDKNCALEMVQAGDVLLECDKLIDRQLERASVSTVAGFAQIYPDAAKGLKYT